MPKVKTDEEMKAPAIPPIYVTQPVLPPLKEFLPYLQQIWDNKILTNGGPFHQQLEKALCDYQGVQHLALFCSGIHAQVAALLACVSVNKPAP